MNHKHIAAAIAIVLIALGWMLRWETIPLTVGSQDYAAHGRALMVNRWTGEIRIILPNSTISTVEK